MTGAADIEHRAGSLEIGVPVVKVESRKRSTASEKERVLAVEEQFQYLGLKRSEVTGR